MRLRHLILSGSAAVVFASIVWLVWSLQNDDSALYAVARSLKNDVCWSGEANVTCAIKAMTKYEKRGRYDDAISVGVRWTQKYPDGFISESIYREIAILYLKRARQDKSHEEEYLQQALLYRDKALPTASDSAYLLQPLLAVSESVGDLSTSERCVQYRNAVKLLDRMTLLLNEDEERVARQFRPDPVERNELECLSTWIRDSSTRLAAKIAKSGCQ